MATQRHLCRLKTAACIGGVSAGIARHLGIDPTLVRITWIVGSLLGASGILLYLIAWLI